MGTTRWPEKQGKKEATLLKRKNTAKMGKAAEKSDSGQILPWTPVFSSWPCLSTGPAAFCPWPLGLPTVIFLKKLFWGEGGSV